MTRCVLRRAFHDLRIHLSRRGYNIHHILALVLRIHHDSAESPQHIDRLRTSFGAVANRPPALTGKARPRRMYGPLRHDVRLQWQYHRTPWTRGRHILRPHRRHEPVPALLGSKVDENARTDLSRLVKSTPEADTRQVSESLVYLRRIRAHRADDAVQFANLCQQHSPSEFAHPEVRPDEPIELGLSESLLGWSTKSAEVVEPCGTFKQSRIRGHHCSTFTGRNGLVQLEAVDTDITDRPHGLALVRRAHALRAIL